MNIFSIYTLKTLRKIYSKISANKIVSKPECERNPDKVSQIITKSLLSNKPCMIARFGATEMTCLCNYIGIKYEKAQYFNYIRSKSNQWWWDQKVIDEMT